jgi:polyisoprenoid-binding protein YceI
MKHFAHTAALALVLILTGQALAADEYKVDPMHAMVLFRIQHAGIGYVHGRFNDPSGSFTLDEADPSKSKFNVEVQVANVDTHNDKRDAHLKSPDFFNAKQYPTITFKSTSVKKGASANTLDVTGDLTLHGVTKSVTVPVELTGKGQFPPGAYRAGVETTFTIKRTDYDIKGIPAMPTAVGEDVRLTVALEGVKQ